MKAITLEKGIFWLTIAVFLMALIIKPGTYIFPFVFPKVIWFRMMTVLLAGCYAGLLMINWPKYRPQWNWISGAVGLFTLSWIISSYVGLDPYRSVWDGHERMLGLFTFLHYALFFFILSAVLKKKEDWKHLCQWFLGIGILVMVTGVIQKFDPYFLYNNGGARVTGTLGNPIYLGGFGYFMILGGAWISLSASVKWEKYFGWGAAALGFLGILFSDSRGPFVGLVGAVGVLVLLYLFNKQTPAKVRQVLTGLVIVAVAFASFIFAFRSAPWVQSIPVVGRLASITLGASGTGTRIMAWEIGLEGWREHPLLGVGPNNYLYVFNQHYRPEFLQLGGWGETWFDNAHNVIVNTLAVQGVLGLTAYLSIFAAAIYVLYQAKKNGQISFSTMACFMGFLVGHLIQMIFVFENTTSYLYLFFVLALIVGISQPTVAVTKDRTLPHWQLGAVGLTIVIVIFSTDIQPARANHLTFNILNGLSESAQAPRILPTVLADYAFMTKIHDPHIDDNRMDFARLSDEQMESIVKVNGKEEGLKLFTLAYEEAKKNRALHPLDVRYHIQQAQLALTGARLTNNSAYVLEAQEALTDALTKSPKRQQLYYILSVAHLYLQDYEGSKKALEETISQSPGVAEGYWRLAGTQIEMGDKAGAKATFERAESLGLVFSDPSSVAAKLRGQVGLPPVTSSTAR